MYAAALGVYLAELVQNLADQPHMQGDDELGALAEIHQQLFRADVNIYASSGVTDERMIAMISA